MLQSAFKDTFTGSLSVRQGSDIPLFIAVSFFRYLFFCCLIACFKITDVTFTSFSIPYNLKVPTSTCQSLCISQHSITQAHIQGPQIHAASQIQDPSTTVSTNTQAPNNLLFCYIQGPKVPSPNYIQGLDTPLSK